MKRSTPSSSVGSLYLLQITWGRWSRGGRRLWDVCSVSQLVNQVWPLRGRGIQTCHIIGVGLSSQRMVHIVSPIGHVPYSSPTRPLHGATTICEHGIRPQAVCDHHTLETVGLQGQVKGARVMGPVYIRVWEKWLAVVKPQYLTPFNPSKCVLIMFCGVLAIRGLGL